ncbi:MAG TPA: T9SS type A sorting domain-containing protein [Puia sp.]|nr:T9SS type A sorting domain-containing protein [Puia sp.]
MKKLYVLFSAAFLMLSFGNPSTAQVYNATTTGLWSQGSTWDINGVPSPTCTNCTITIKGNSVVTLDVAFSMAGNTQLLVGDGPTSTAKIIIPPSSNTQFAPHNTISFASSATGVTIKLNNANNAIDAQEVPYTAPDGQYDGIIIFSGFFGLKLVGEPSYPFGFPGPPALASYGPIITGASTINSIGVLPIFLKDFNAVLDGKQVDLTWTSSQEINSDHFGIEHSSDAVNWNTLGIVKAKGFSSIAVNYSFTDVAPFAGINYYRLQMVDKDGKYKYSDIKVVRTSLITGVNIFPNPASNFVNVTIGTDFTGDATIRVINLFGQLLQERKLTQARGTTIYIPVENYAQGNYILQIIGSNGVIKTGQILIKR